MDPSDRPGRLLPCVVEELAATKPDQIYCIHPKSQDVHDGWLEINFQVFAAAVDRLAWWITRQLKVNSEPHVLAYLGTNDLRYAAFILACAKTGHVALLLSTRNSQAAFRHLLQATKCTILVDGADKVQLRKAIDELEAHSQGAGLQRWRIGSFSEIFFGERMEPFPSIISNYADVEDCPVIIIHSSGTTGLPKPVVLTNGYLATIDNMKYLPIPEGRKSAQFFLHHQGNTRLMHGPLFHFIGLVCMSECIFYQTPFLLLPDRPLTAEMLEVVMTAPHAPQWALLAPFILEELNSSERGRKALSKLTSINYGGAPISKSVGQSLASLFQLQTLMGSSETGYTPTLLCRDSHDWNYMEWNPHFGVKMDDLGDGLWELVIPRQKSRQYHGIFHVNPTLQEYRTGDLFIRHPSKEDLWKYEGRRDDIIVLKNGEKFNPIDAEQLIQTSEFVHRAAIFGQGQFQASLLLEPHWDSLPPGWTDEEMKKRLRPLIQAANAELPSHGQILESHLVFASPEKPFALSPKGTLRRREIFNDYKSTFDSLYNASEQNQPLKARVEDISQFDLADVESWLAGKITDISGLQLESHKQNIFDLGMDSLQALTLVSLIQEAIELTQPLQREIIWTSTKLYECGTIEKIAEEIRSHTPGSTMYDHEAGTKRAIEKDSSDGSQEESHWSREENLTRMIWEQARFLPGQGCTVALTGSTGELGSYLLSSLLQHGSITRIICLNRSADAKTRQKASFRAKGLSTVWLDRTDRVTFLCAQLDVADLGLSFDSYRFLQENVDIVIHNAWAVNFNLPVASFEAHLKGMRHLLELVDRSKLLAKFHFISSITTVNGQPGGVVKEMLHGVPLVFPQGYGESKFIAEQLCGIASRRTKSPIFIHRVGQLGGPSKASHGMWNPRDWFPTLIQSSLALQKVPSDLGRIQVDWLPIDTAASIIVQIVQNRASHPCSGLMVYHIKNPRLTPWSELNIQVAKACKAEFVSLEKWIQAVEDTMRQEWKEKGRRAVPAASLLEFFRALQLTDFTEPLVIETQNAEKHSPLLSSLDPVDNALMGVWLNQWRTWLPDLADPET